MSDVIVSVAVLKDFSNDNASKPAATVNDFYFMWTSDYFSRFRDVWFRAVKGCDNISATFT
jgi:hypothetical protein